MKLEIHWQEAYVSELFPHTVEGMQNLVHTRIYLRIKSYLGGRMGACEFVALATTYKNLVCGVWLAGLR